MLRESCLTLHVEDCGGWWSSSCRGSVAEHWQPKPVVSYHLGLTPGDCWPFHFVHLRTSRMILHLQSLWHPRFRCTVFYSDV